jgi:hypothetical protein
MPRFVALALCVAVCGLGSFAAAQNRATDTSAPMTQAAPLADAWDVERIKNAIDGKTAAEINKLLPGLVGDIPISNSLGQADSDLVYVPVAPCRIIDTRSGGGAFAANETRSYKIAGSTNYSAYGGNPAGCGIPGDLVSNPIDIGGFFILQSTPKVRALALNFVAVGAAGDGDLRVWPSNLSMPLASILNYAAVGGLNIANGVIVTSCNQFSTIGTPCSASDISIIADASPTHLVVDVAGYYVPASGYGQRSSVDVDPNVSMSTTCASYASRSLTNRSAYARTVVCMAVVSTEMDHVASADDVQGLFKLGNVNNDCTVDAWGDGGTALFRVPPGAPTTYHWASSPLLTTFELDAGASATYYLNGRLAGGTARFVGASLTCFIP